MKPAKGEVRQMVELLDRMHDDVEELAGEVLSLAYQLYEQKEEHGLLFQQDDLYLVVRGFPTALQAEKWGVKQGLKPGKAVLATIKTGDQV